MVASMIDARFLSRLAMTAALVSALAGCARTAQQCDPGQVDNVFSAANCQAFGGFDAHLENARAEVEALRVEVAAAQGRAAGASRDAQLLAGDRDALQRRMASEKRDLDRLRLKLAGLRVDGDKGRARLAALQEQLKTAEAKLAGMDRAGISAQEIQALEADIAARKEAIARLSGRALQE